MKSTRRSCGRSGGFLLLDVLTGIVVGLAILVVMSATVAQYHRGARRLADQRAAVHLAERVLTDLQTGQTPNLQDGGCTSTIVDLPGPGPTPRTRWVEVRVTGPGNFSLVGLAPTGVPNPTPASTSPPPVVPATKAEAQP